MKNGDMCYSLDGEIFNYFEPDFDGGESYYSGVVKNIKPSGLVASCDVTALIESMEEQLFDIVGDVSDGNFYISEDKQKELELLIKDFMDKNATITCFSVVDIKEHNKELEK